MARLLHLRLLRSGEHGVGAAFASAALLCTGMAVFDTEDPPELVAVAFLVWILLFFSALLRAVQGGASDEVLVSSSSPPSVGCNDIDLRFLEDSSSFLSTALVAYTAVCWMFERHTVVRGCWVALSYLMYLLQSFGGDLFASLVRCDIAERREDRLEPPSDDGIELERTLQPLLDAAPEVVFKAECMHKIGRKTSGMTHRAVEWLPIVAWRDITVLPEATQDDAAFMALSLVIRLGGEAAAIEDAEARFKQNHNRDDISSLSRRVLVNRLTSDRIWSGFWRLGDRGAPLSAVYAVGALALCAFPVQLWLRSRTRQVVVVVEKETSIDVDSGLPEGWRPGLPQRKPTGDEGQFGWTFPVPETDEAALQSLTALPHLSLFDIVTHLSRQCPLAVEVATASAFLVEAVLALNAAQGRGFLLAACALGIFVVALQFGRFAMHAKSVWMLRGGKRMLVAISASFATAVAILTLLSCSLWFSVVWDEALGPSLRPHATSQLGIVPLDGVWAVRLVDGFVDTSAQLSANLTCQVMQTRKGQRARGTFPCHFVYAAPIYEAGGRLQQGASPRAWAVDKRPVALPECREGHLCGILAARILPTHTMERLRSLTAAAEPGRDLPMLVLEEPTGTGGYRPHLRMFLALVIMVFLSPAGTAAAADLAGTWRPSMRDVGASGALAAEEDDDLFAGQALLSRAKHPADGSARFDAEGSGSDGGVGPSGAVE